MATKSKPKPKAEEPNIPKLFSQLQVLGEDGNYKKGLKLVERLLQLCPEDRDVLHCKVVCLVQLSKFQDANKLIDSLNKKSEKQQFLFEKGYCLYRLEKYNESRHLLQKLPQSDPRVQELVAQVAYRLERFGEARSTYATMVKEVSDDFSNEREANYAAALSLTPKAVGEVHLKSLHAENMEQSFNLACCYLAQGRGKEAEEMLHKAEELCRESLQEEDCTEEEIESELSAVYVQLGYALQIQDRGKEAMSLYSSVLKQKPDDTSHSVIASNNIIVLNRDRDVFDSKKKAKVLANEGNSKKLTRLQKLVILYNRCLFALQTNQLEQCRELIAELKATHPNSDGAVLAEVALLGREKKMPSCVELLESHLQAKPHSDLVLYATLAQLLLSQGHMSKVCDVLHSIPDISKHLGVISVLVSLHTNLGDVDSAVEVLDKAEAWWARQQKSESMHQVCRSLMMESAQYKLQHGKPQAAAAVLERLQSDYPSDLRIQALLISAFSRFDSRRAEELTKSLQSFEAAGVVDVDALEQMPSFRHTRRQVQKPEGVSETQGEKKESVVKDKKRKRKRKPKLPKNYNPSATPDPERWLPLRERSYYRKGRKKGVLVTSRGSQGASTASASLTAQLDASKPSFQELPGMVCPSPIPRPHN